MPVVIELLPESEGIPRLVHKEWRDRANAVMDYTVRETAEGVLEKVRDALPNGDPSIEAIKKALRMSRVRGLRDEEYAYAVHAPANAASAEELKPDNVILYVELKRLPARLPKRVKILADHGPWTLDTLPFYPDRKWATVVSRNVNVSVVSRIKKERKADESAWVRKLQEAGVRKPLKGQVVFPRGSSAVPDIAFDSLRYEFGLGAQSAPHWRPAVLAAKTLTPKIGKRREVHQMMMNPKNRSWAKKVSVPGLPLSKLKKFVPFQKLLGIR